MNYSLTVEFIALYLPAIVAAIAALSVRIYPRLRVAILLSSLWQAATLPWLNHIAIQAGCWSFSPSIWQLFGIPTTLYLGWVISWGVITTLVMGKLPVRKAALWVALIATAVDVLLMPLMEPILILHSTWLIGEMFAVLAVLVPSLVLTHYTLLDKRPALRAGLISAAFILFILGVLPLSTTANVSLALQAICSKFTEIEHTLWWGCCLLLGTPGLAGVIEFARIGKGTPIPYDPPKHPVTTGVYAYLRNPMQTSMVLVLFVWTPYLDSQLCLILSGAAILYSCGIAHWSENVDLDKRFGSSLKKHRASIRPWLPKLHPAPQASPAQIYFDFGCSSCLEICRWFETHLTKLNRSDLAIHDARKWSGVTPLLRVTYVYPDGINTTQGVKAIASALQHLHLGWAYLGWLIQLPVFQQITQIAMDSTISTRLDSNTKKEPQ